MKKIFTLLAFIFTITTFAQAPQGFNYQATVRNSSGALIVNQNVNFKFNIMLNSATSLPVFSETHMAPTDDLGQVNLVIGTGTATIGTFSTINWGTGNYYLGIEIDTGSGYVAMGTTQLMSVPYALHAKTAETVTGGIPETDPVFGASLASGITGTDTTNWNNKQDQLVAGTNITIVGNTISATGGSSNDFYLGQDTLGGIVFYIYIGSDGNQHGLIVNKNESTVQWQSSGTTTNATRSWDGVYNTGLMTSSPAANYVNGLTDGGFTDWYLPSIDELSILWHNRFHANNALNAGGFTLLANSVHYWSSTETSSTLAFTCYFTAGLPNASNKANTYSVRAVRAF
jgi:hypothetical protein